MEKCKTCGCEQSTHTGKAAAIVLHASNVHNAHDAADGYCLACMQKPNACFAFQK